MTEAWYRNPRNYIRECAELLVPNLIYHRGSAVNYRIEPRKQVEAFYPAGFGYRLLVVENEWCREFRRGSAQPIHSFPVWCYNQHNLDDLIALLERPVNPNVEHRVVIDWLPPLNTGPGKQLLGTLRELQQEYEDAIIHLTGASSMTAPLGAALGAVDMNPRQLPAHGGVLLPSGRFLSNWKDAEKYQSWIEVVGMTWDDIQTPSGRCKLSMRSFAWAAEHYNSELRFALNPKGDVDPDAIKPKRATSKSWVMGRRIKPIASDKIACDKCTIAPGCRLYRAQGVCAIPGTDGAKLAKMYGTRNVEQIIDAQAGLQEIMVTRAVDGVNEEKLKNSGVTQVVTKALKDAFDSGVSLAKLVDPSLARAHAGGTNILMMNGRPVAQHELSAAEVASWAFNELLGMGVPMEDIDVEMVGQFIANSGRKAIEAQATDVTP